MSIDELHKLTGELIANGHGSDSVMIDFSTYQESEDGNILSVESGEIRSVSAIDDSGPTGDEFMMLVLSGGLKP